MDHLLWSMAVEAAAETAAAATPSGTHREAMEAKTGHLERRLEKLTLVCQALWTLLRERTGVTDEDLAHRVREIDLTDGRLDGRMAPAFTCERCGRVTARRHGRCLYCEAPRQGNSPFEGV
jgi:hypothetical protein